MFRLRLLDASDDGDGASTTAVTAAADGPAAAASVPLRVFDPVLGVAERALLREFGCDDIDHNEGGARRAGGGGGAADDDNVAGPTTLFFMPHCPLGLYSSVLRANWGERGDGLTRLLIVGNSFASYDDRIMPRAEQRCDRRVASRGRACGRACAEMHRALAMLGGE